MDKDKSTPLVHEEHARYFRQKNENYLIEKYGLPKPLDKSFIEKEERERRVKQCKRAAIVIAGIILFLSGYSTGFIRSNTDQAYAEKGLIQRVYQSIMGIDTDKQDDNAEKNKTNVEVTDFKDLDEAKDVMGELYVPDYLPAGFEFVKLTARKTGSDAKAVYEYNKGNACLHITLVSTDDDASYASNDSGELIKLRDRLIYVYDDPDSVSVLIDQYMIMIRGDVSQREMVRVGKGLTKSE